MRGGAVSACLVASEIGASSSRHRASGRCSGGDCSTSRSATRSEPPTAIFLGNDEMAVGAYQAIRKAGLRIPEDISVVGFDDTPMASRVWPPMTSVRLPIRDMGAAAASLLLAAARDEYPNERVTFTPEIVVRESTAAPKKA